MKGWISIIMEEYQIIPRMTVKSNKEGLMIIETNEKDFNKKLLKTFVRATHTPSLLMPKVAQIDLLPTRTVTRSCCLGLLLP